MIEYITKDQAYLCMLENWDDDMLPGDYDDLLREIPPADVAPVIYAKWKFVAGPNEDNNLQFMCDNCGAGDVHATNATVPYCWRCGARMDGGESDD